MRLFIGLPITGTLKAELTKVIEQLREKSEYRHLRFTLPENLHLTLHFLGQTSEEKCEMIQSAITESLKHCPPFHIRGEKLIALPSLKFARVLALYIKPNRDLMHLSQTINKELDKLNHKKDRYKFLPHISIARIKHPHDLPRIPNLHHHSLQATIDSVALYQSQLERPGAQYHIHKTFYLKDKR